MCTGILKGVPQAGKIKIVTIEKRPCFVIIFCTSLLFCFFYYVERISSRAYKNHICGDTPTACQVLQIAGLGFFAFTYDKKTAALI